jgi:TatA/E family protein of Tat protein translocase
MLGSLGVPELMFILVLALLVFGPKRLPEIGRTLGRGMSEFRKATNELKRSINTEMALDETPAPASLRPRRVDGTPATPEVAEAAAARYEPEPREAPAATEPRSATPANPQPVEPS